MIKAVIIDDEINAQSLLGKTLDRYFHNKFNIMEKCNSVDLCVLAIKKHDPPSLFF
jgi:two-component system LytT family response regulator